MRRLVLFAVFAGLALLAGPACDWRKFDDIKGSVPVLAVGAPEGFAATSEDFGRVLAPTSPPADGSAAARFVVAGAGENAVAIVTLDAAGKASSQVVEAGELEALSGRPVTSIANIPGTERVLLGAPETIGSVGGHVLRMNLTAPYEATSFVTSTTESLFGAGVVADNLGGGPAAELVVLSASALHVYLDGVATDEMVQPDTAACPLLISGSPRAQDLLNRPVAIGRNLLGTGGVQIVVGTPRPAGGGNVAIFMVDTAARTFTCALNLVGTDNRFGQSLVIGDFNNDAAPDLLVGSPPKSALLFTGPITTPTPTATIMNAMGVNFGASVAALPLDNQPGDEALIADPEATADGEQFGGNVSIFTGPALATKRNPTPATTVMADGTPSNSDFYGSVVRVLPFCGSAPAGPDGGALGTGTGCTATGLPLVGSATRVFTYFTLGTSDPRQ